MTCSLFVLAGLGWFFLFDLFLGLSSKMMDFSYSPTQQSIVTSIENIMANFDDNYWLAADREGQFPDEFY